MNTDLLIAASINNRKSGYVVGICEGDGLLWRWAFVEMGIRRSTEPLWRSSLVEAMKHLWRTGVGHSWRRWAFGEEMGIRGSVGHSWKCWAFGEEMGIRGSVGHWWRRSAYVEVLGIRGSVGHSGRRWAFVEVLGIDGGVRHSWRCSAFEDETGIYGGVGD